ncbi:uncharacterized protein JCM15063_002170 [Sporobolomyces koalae]|uniref:uncharacterized protein n=1 Tax=Sporobolomyces koalae TaxID=500713 RepID=UPI00317131FE
MERTIRSLTRHYPRRDEAVVQVLAVLERFQGVLNPEQSDFTYDDGRVELLLSLTGVLPIPINTNVYHCPIVFWLPLDFPSTPPIVFILPSETLAVRKGKNVDAGGRVTTQYLDQWSRKSEACSLLALIEDLIPIFSARYPVTTIQPKPPARPSPPTSSPAGISAASSTPQPPPPRPTFPSGSTASSSGPSTGQQPPRPPPPPQPSMSNRLEHAAGDLSRRPQSVGSVTSTSNGLPSRPPLPPVSPYEQRTAPSPLPPGPPPGYHPSAGPPVPPYAHPHRTSTIEPVRTSSPLANQSSVPPMPPEPPVPHTYAPASLGAPISSSQAARAATQPLPGTFTAPPRPPQPHFVAAHPDNVSTHRPRPDQALARPASPTGSTARSYTPASITESIPSTPQQYPSSTRQEQQYRREPREALADAQSARSSRQGYAESAISYSPSQSSVVPPSSSAHLHQERPRPPALDQHSHARYSHSPAPSHDSSRSSHLHAISVRERLPPAASETIASPSEYNAEYGSYRPPAMSTVAGSTFDGVESDYDDERRQFHEVQQAMAKLSSRERSMPPPSSAYAPYQSTQHEHGLPQPPRPPSEVFEPALEARSRPQPPHQPRRSTDSAPTGFPSYRTSASNGTRIGALPPPVGHSLPYEYSHSGAMTPRQSMRTSLVTARAVPKPSVNILDAADEDLESPSSVVPTSPSSISSRGGPILATVPSNAPPPVPPNPALLALRTRVHSKLTNSLANLHSDITKNHLEPLALMHSDLQKAVPAIEDEMARLRAVRDVCLTVRDRYKGVVEEGEKRMLEYERKGEGVDVDEIICGSTVVYVQLLDLVAEDCAIEDTIYALGRGLNSGTAKIELDQFLKRVRALAREQFIKRATINKILLGLAIRRERNSQQQRDRREAAVSNTSTHSRETSGQGTRASPRNFD